MKTAFVKFTSTFKNIETVITLLETEDKLYVHVTQNPTEMCINNNQLKNLLDTEIKKDTLCICNLKDTSTLNDISKKIIRIFSEN